MRFLSFSRGVGTVPSTPSRTPIDWHYRRGWLRVTVLGTHLAERTGRDDLPAILAELIWPSGSLAERNEPSEQKAGGAAEARDL